LGCFIDLGISNLHVSNNSERFGLFPGTNPFNKGQSSHQGAGGHGAADPRRQKHLVQSVNLRG